MPGKTGLAMVFGACVAVVAACESSTEIVGRVPYAGALNSAREKPTSNSSAATGQATLVARSDGTLYYLVTWTGLSGAVTGAHIHGPADTANTAPVLVDFAVPPPGSTGHTITTTAAGSATATIYVSGFDMITPTVSGDSLIKLLNAGRLYVNVHTATNPGGEIRGQLIRQ